MDDDKAQLAALGRCGGRRCPHTREDECAADIARVATERDVLRGALHEATGLLEQLDAYHPAGDCDSCAMIRAALGGERRPTGAEMERDALRDALVTARAEEREACARVLDALAAGVRWHETGDARVDAARRRGAETTRAAYEQGARSIRAMGGDR